jgi:hypothetical protein
MPVIDMTTKLKVDLAEITRTTLDTVGNAFDQYVVFPSPEARDAVVLWAMHAHVATESFDTSPRLSIRSQDPGSGKTRVLEILNEIIPGARMVVNLTPGTMWRYIEHNDNLTLLMDEVDTVFGRNGSSSSHTILRSIINTGYRRGATVPRCVGSTDVKEFNVYGPVAMAGLGRLPDTVASRSVEIKMRRRRPTDPEVQSFRIRFAGPQLAHVRKVIEIWATYAAAPLRVSLPDLPVDNRDADVWEPLVAIADLAGEEWGLRARTACKALTESKELSVGPALLVDIREAFGEDIQLPTVELLVRLKSLPDSEWRHDTFTGRTMSKILAEFGITSQAIRYEGEVVRGYKREAFATAWKQYTD